MRRPGDPYDVVVIGGGLAGLTAAHHAALRGMAVVCIDEGGHMGGLVMNVSALDGYPAMGTVGGAELASGQLEAILDLGVEIVPDTATALSIDGDIKTVSTGMGDQKAKHVILASGARLKSLGVPGEENLFGRGVSQCADCDAGFFVDQKVVVVGGGDSALQEALHLADYASEITLVTRGNGLRAKQSYVTRAAENPKFTFRWETQVPEITGSDGVEGVKLVPAGGGDAEDFACTGVFVFVGLQPNTEFLSGSLECDDAGFVKTDTSFATNVEGVYAVGAVRQGFSGQLASAAGEAASVAASLPVS
ncbi:MAG: FAD-dependent oxidoreductase [Rhodospirillaceae bacterium]|nr:FAD-dependent oxidoreductase [Rhodospirillaceae bacterium]